MKTFCATKKDLYYTEAHEWIDYQGSVAYIGVSPAKLKGIKNIENLNFQEDHWFKKQGEIIATLCHEGKQIPVRMPVDGRIINFNDRLKSECDVLLNSPDGEGWVAHIAPAQPYERKGLLQGDQYRTLLHTK